MYVSLVISGRVKCKVLRLYAVSEKFVVTVDIMCVAQNQMKQ